MRQTKANNYADGPGKKSAKPAPVIPISPYQQAYKDNNFLLDSIRLNPSYVMATRGQLEAYYKYLPAVSRGQLVPDGYPKLYSGMYGAATNTYPRIIPLQPTVKASDVITWTNPNVSAAWTEALKKAVPDLAKVPARNKATLAEIMAKGKPAITDSRGKVSGWYYKGSYFTVEWAVLFDRLFQRGKIWADPSSPYMQENYKAWISLDFFESARNFAEVFAVAVGAAEAAAVITGGSAGSVAATPASATSAVAPATTAETQGAISTVESASGTLETVGASGGTLAGTLSTATGVIGAGEKILGAVAATAAALGIGKAAAKPAATKTAAPAAPASSWNLKTWATIAAAAGVAFIAIIGS